MLATTFLNLCKTKHFCTCPQTAILQPVSCCFLFFSYVTTISSVRIMSDNKKIRVSRWYWHPKIFLCDEIVVTENNTQIFRREAARVFYLLNKFSLPVDPYYYQHGSFLQKFSISRHLNTSSRMNGNIALNLPFFTELPLEYLDDSKPRQITELKCKEVLSNHQKEKY